MLAPFNFHLVGPTLLGGPHFNMLIRYAPGLLEVKGERKKIQGWPRVHAGPAVATRASTAALMCAGSAGQAATRRARSFGRAGVLLASGASGGASGEGDFPEVIC